VNKRANARVGAAAGVENLACEVKFLLDTDRVLTKEKRLKKKFGALFALGPVAKAIDVLYLETPDKAFLSDGWVVRIRSTTDAKRSCCHY
jgi:hypothetical protein